MPVDDLRFVLVAVAFGALMGWGLARRAGDRRAVIASIALAAAIGVVAWIVGMDHPGSDPAVAGVTLTLGAGAALVSAVVTGRAGEPPA